MPSQPAPGDRVALPAPRLGQHLHGRVSTGTGRLEGPGGTSCWPGPPSGRALVAAPRGRRWHWCPVGRPAVAPRGCPPETPQGPGACTACVWPSRGAEGSLALVLGPTASPEALRRAGRHRAVLPRPPQPHGADQGAAEKVGAAPGPEAGEGPGREGATRPLGRLRGCPSAPPPAPQGHGPRAWVAPDVGTRPSSRDRPAVHAGPRPTVTSLSFPAGWTSPSGSPPSSSLSQVRFCGGETPGGGVPTAPLPACQPPPPSERSA